MWPHRVPPPFWRQVIGAMKERPGTTDFIAWTPGLDDAAAAALAACGFERAACSLPFVPAKREWSSNFTSTGDPHTLQKPRCVPGVNS